MSKELCLEWRDAFLGKKDFENHLESANLFDKES